MFKAINTDDNQLFTLNIIGMSYYVSYHHSLGDTSIRCYAWEVAGILRNMVHMAIQGHKFSNVTIVRV